MDDEYKFISTKLLEFELQGFIAHEQKLALASAISRILHEALAERDALKVVHIQAMEARLDKIKLVFEVPHYEMPDQGYKVKTSDDKAKRKVFLVHGHDQEMRQKVASVLTKLELEPIILDEKPNLGRTIIEKFTDYSEEVGYAVVLLSPDDMGYSKKDGNDKARSRARQNVVFELGYFMGKIGRDKVAALYQVSSDIEIPSDFFGVTYIPYDNSNTWKLRLATELRATGLEIDANKPL